MKACFRIDGNEYDFDGNECDFDGNECDFDGNECDFDGDECDFDGDECDFRRMHFYFRDNVINIQLLIKIRLLNVNINKKLLLSKVKELLIIIQIKNSILPFGDLCMFYLIYVCLS